MEQPPLSSASVPARSSKLAITSLVLGILGLLCFSIFTGIPAVILGHKARGRIRQSGGAEGGAGMALAGLITGYLSIVMFVVSLVVLVPLVIQAKTTGQTLKCVANLRMIDFAKEQWATENEKKPTDVPTADDLKPLMEKPLDSLKCPLNGTYTINAVGEKPTCSVPAHKLN